MRSTKNILVAIPPNPDSPALGRGRQLALKLGATLDLLVCDAHEDQADFLAQQLASLREAGVQGRGEQARVEFGQASSAVLKACRELGCDLVVKEHQRAARFSQLLMTPDDWQLLRQVPTPLFLIRNSRPWEDGTILAGMDVEHHDGAHVALQGNVMEHASELCRLFDAKLHVVSAYSSVRLPQADPNQSIEQAAANHCRDQCQWFLEMYELPGYRVHIGEGPAKALISQIAHEFEAVLTVLGTVARHGVMGALVGNTAEAVLDRLEGDLLVIKPTTAQVEEPVPRGHRAA
ncbi:universal stress protein [Pseudomonas sp. BN102]|uniref:universal stress protein n=1 Tax=Pseudomonas sp. BN102 TaxID=2567886 RepID=UPI002456CEB3|nr:universal stress protein [Pseudomonas sp. BN102]